MLERNECRSLAGRRSSLLGLLFGALFALPLSTGCAAISSEQDADAKFLVAPQPDSTFFGWSEITIQEDANSVDKATLQAVTVEVLDPPEITDLSFLQSVVGEVVTSTQRIKGVEKKTMPKDERVVPLDIIYTDDLRSFFEDGHTIRIEWTGSTNPAFTAWPAGGIWIRAHLVVHVE